MYCKNVCVCTYVYIYIYMYIHMFIKMNIQKVEIQIVLWLGVDFLGPCLEYLSEQRVSQPMWNGKRGSNMEFLLATPIGKHSMNLLCGVISRDLTSSDIAVYWHILAYSKPLLGMVYQCLFFGLTRWTLLSCRCRLKQNHWNWIHVIFSLFSSISLYIRIKST